MEKEYCKTCGKPVRYEDGVLKEGVHQVGQGYNKPLLSFCSKKCLEGGDFIIKMENKNQSPQEKIIGEKGKKMIERDFVKNEVLPIHKSFYIKKGRDLQIKNELKFLNCQGIKSCVKDADFGACHEDCPTIENRKKKLKKLLDAKEEIDGEKNEN